MDSNQLNRYADKLKLTNFLGVFASDELSLLPKSKTGLLIFNTDSTQDSGQHWISLCITKECIFYFDSLNLNFQLQKNISDFLIKLDKNLVLNSIQTQTNESIDCGKHCLTFCYIMSIEPSVSQYKRWLHTFSNHNIQEREELLLAYFDIINSKFQATQRYYSE